MIKNRYNSYVKKYRHKWPTINMKKLIIRVLSDINKKISHYEVMKDKDVLVKIEE